MRGVRLILFISLLVLTVEALAQVDTAWVRRYNGPGNLDDFALALAVDNSGNVYVTGYSYGSGGTPDYATIKYAPNGDTTWVRGYNGPGNLTDVARALAVDNSGNVYVTGVSSGTGTGGDYATIKYASNGDTLWVRRYNGPGNSTDLPLALAVDNNGNVYVTGYSYGSGGTPDYATIKYAPNGDTLWVGRYISGNLADYANALAVDTSGNVSVTGLSYGSGSDYDYATIKYAPNGDITWVRRYDGPGNSNDGARALAVDNNGNVYVTGNSHGSGSGPDYATIKYAPNADTTWVRRYNGPGNFDDAANALAVDTSGNVYVTGLSPGSGSYYDYATIKYAPNGDTLWVRRYNGPGNSYDEARGLTVDNNGNVYVTGSSEGSGSSRDYATIKYAPNGDTLWVRRYNGPGDSGDYASALAVDTSGNVYVTGRSLGSGTLDDYATIKYSPDADNDGIVDYKDNCPSIANVGQLDADTDGVGDTCDICPAVFNPLQENAKPGDANASGTYTLADPIAIVNYIFNKPGFPACASNSAICWLSDLLCRGDWNGSTTVTLSDVIRAVNYIFNKPGGPWDALVSGACCL